MAGDETGNGWIKLYRKILDNPMYFSEPFTRMQAWIDLLLLANHSGQFFYVRGNRVEVNRGEVAHSMESLAQRWKWSRGKVLRYISHLENSQMLIQQKSSVITKLSICNYNTYQANGTTDSTTDGQQIVQQTDTNKNVKKVKKEKNDNKEIDKSFLDQPFPDKSKKFNFKKVMIDYGFEEKLVDEWMTIRKSKKAVNSELAFKNFIAEVKETGMNINDVLFIVAVEKQWKGFKASWLENDKEVNGKFDPDAERKAWLAREAAAAFGEIQ